MNLLVIGIYNEYDPPKTIPFTGGELRAVNKEFSSYRRSAVS